MENENKTEPNKYVEAVNKFKASVDFALSRDANTLGTKEPEKYLENRLLRAFEAGWNAKNTADFDELKEACEWLLNFAQNRHPLGTVPCKADCLTCAKFDEAKVALAKANQKSEVL